MNPELEAYREKLRAMMPELAVKYGVTRLGIFGSRLRGDHRPDSDLDILFDYDKPMGLLELCGLEVFLSDQLGLKVDLVPRNSLKPYIGRRILSEVQYL